MRPCKQGTYGLSPDFGSFAVSDAYNRYPLAVKLHASDLIATYLMEQGTSNVENGHPKTK